jgi:hypothetical protein
VEEGLGTATIVGGEGAPMGGDGGCGVLHHRCGRGKRELAPIWEWRSSEGAHWRGGRQRRRSAKSDVRERPRWPEAAVRARKRWGRSGVGDEGADEGVNHVFERAWSAARLRGKRRREVGVVSGRGGCHAAWGMAPTDGRRPDRVSDGRDLGAACVCGTSLFGQRHAGR